MSGARAHRRRLARNEGSVTRADVEEGVAAHAALYGCWCAYRIELFRHTGAQTAYVCVTHDEACPAAGKRQFMIGTPRV